MSTQDEPIPVPSLPWYETLRRVLEPYSPAKNETESDHQWTSAEIIAAIEQHHGIPQGPVDKKITEWVHPEDFVRAMRYLGYQDASYGGLNLYWLMKKKK